jgi:NAD(P)-dependent dehydrogenase (short-subunit alcohol dehydrogenase family)
VSKGTAFVTGANSGIGLATALELAKQGFNTIGTVRSSAKGRELKKAASEAGVEVTVEQFDVTDADRGFELIDAHRPDVLVNNAGYGMSAPMELVEDEEAEHLLATMLIAPIRLARFAIPHMREAGRGRIINISSILGRVTMPLSGWYQAAKHGLEAATDALRIEIARDKIFVILIEPGLFRTAIFDDLDADARRYGNGPYGDVYARLRQSMEQAQPFLGDPIAVAHTIARAASTPRPRARYLVGNDARLLDITRGLTPTAIQDMLQRRVAGL